MVNGTINQKFISIIIIHAPNKKSLKLNKEKLTELKGDTEDPTIIVVDSNTTLSVSDGNNNKKSGAT